MGVNSWMGEIWGSELGGELFDGINRIEDAGKVGIVS